MDKLTMRKIPTLACLALLLSCSSYSVIKKDSQLSTLNELYLAMQGSYSSQKQSEEDEDYFDIRLEMIPIWQDNPDGLWLYVEQASATALARPYRQRVYHLTELSDERYSSGVYELPNALDYAGAWKQDSPLSNLSSNGLKLREGCAVILAKQPDGSFKGSTVDKNCKSKLRGASYATSIVEINAEGITSWDQGFDVNDKQVWGAEKWPYIFLR